NRSKVDMPKVSAQGKTFDPVRTVNRSIRPFISDLWLQERISGRDYPDRGAIGSQALGIVKIAGNQGQTLLPCRCKVGECWGMKRFAVSAAQGQRANPLGVKRLPANGKFRLLRIKLGVLLRQNRSCGRVLAVPFLALSNAELETVRSWKIPGGAGYRNTHFLIDAPNVPVYP